MLLICFITCLLYNQHLFFSHFMDITPYNPSFIYSFIFKVNTLQNPLKNICELKYFYFSKISLFSAVGKKEIFSFLSKAYLSFSVMDSSFIFQENKMSISIFLTLVKLVCKQRLLDKTFWICL